MDTSYEKKWPHDMSTSSAAVLIDHPIQVQRAPVQIRHHFVFSLFSALCLCPATGLIALAYSLKSSAKADVNFHEKSRLYARRALFWNLVSIVFAVVSFLLTLIFFCRLGELMRVHGQRFDQQQQASDIDRVLQSIANNN